LERISGYGFIFAYESSRVESSRAGMASLSAKIEDISTVCFEGIQYTQLLKGVTHEQVRSFFYLSQVFEQTLTLESDDFSFSSGDDSSSSSSDNASSSSSD
jgi:hypothetical protein